MSTVAVIIPTYKVDAIVDRAIDSVLAQSLQPHEIIIVDDASEDGTIARLRQKYGFDGRFKFLIRPFNGGPSLARNDGIKLSKAEWIAVLDADDAWMPNRLEKLIRHSKDADFVADNLTTFDAVANKETGPFFPPFDRRVLTLEDSLIGWIGNNVADCGILKPIVRQSFLARHALGYDPDLRYGEDYLLYCSALLLGARFILVDSYGYIYTTLVGARSKRRSPHSRSEPCGLQMAQKLAELKQKESRRLTSGELLAFDYRIRVLSNIKAWWDFEVAVRTRLIPEAASLFRRHPYVRERCFEYVRRHLGRRRRLRPVLDVSAGRER